MLLVKVDLKKIEDRLIKFLIVYFKADCKLES